MVAPPSIAERQNLFILPDKNLIVGGDCNAQHLFRLDSLRPVETYTDPGCATFHVSKHSGKIIRTWNDSITLHNLEDGVKTDLIPGAQNGFNSMRMTFLPNDNDVFGGYAYKPDLYRIDLGSKQWRKIGSHRAGLNVEGVGVSQNGSVGVSVARYPSKSSEVISWDLTTNRKLASYAAETATLSKDGSLLALAVKVGEHNVRLELRRFRDGQLLGQINAGDVSTSQYGDELTDGALVLMSDGSTICFLKDNADNIGDLELRTWRTSDTETKLLFKLEADYLDDIISIRPDLNAVFLLQQNGVSKFALPSGKPDENNPSAEPLEPVSAAISTDGQIQAVASWSDVAIVDTATAGVLRTFKKPENIRGKESGSIKTVIFIPRTTTLVVGDDSGHLYTMNSNDGSANPIYSRTETQGQSQIDGIAVSDNGQLVAFAQDTTAYVITTGAGEIVARFPIAKLSGLRGRKIAFVDDDKRLLVGAWQIEVFDLRQKNKILNYPLQIFVDRIKYFNLSTQYVARTDFFGGTWIIGAWNHPGGNTLFYRDGKIVRHFGAGRPGSSWESGRARMAVSTSPTQIAFGHGGNLRTTDDSMGSWTRIGIHSSDVISLDYLKTGQLVSSSKDGQVRFGRTNSEAELVTTHLYADGSWVALTREGFFSGSPEAIRRLLVRTGKTDVVPLDSFYQSLYRPDLVIEKLAGDPQGRVREAAAKLDLGKAIASGAAPRVAILTPVSNSAASNDEVEVEASIADQGGGIGKLEWRVNGITLGVESRGLDRLPAPGVSSSPVRPPITAKRILSLDLGENKIEVVAYNGLNLIASDAAQIVVNWDGQKTAVPLKLHVLTVGVNDYFDSRLRLSYAVPDAKALGDALKKAGNGIYGEVEVTTVLDADVTADNLDKVFTTIGNKVHARDVFVFFLAGHGKTKNGRYYFLPRDFRYEDESSIEKRGIDQDRFQTWFAKIAARKSILLYDTCESGSLTATRATRGDIDERLGALNRMTRATGRTFLVATTDDAPALEGYRGHGIFTYVLLDGLGAADANRNGLIEVSELADYVDAKVPDLSFEAFKLRQIPQRNIVGNNFALASATSVMLPASNAAPTALPTKPTHVVASPAPIEVFESAVRNGNPVQQLAPGTLVTIVETANGWQLVARDGQKLGYIEDKGTLARLQ